MKITKGTIVRLIAVVFVVINLILKALGKNTEQSFMLCSVLLL